MGLFLVSIGVGAVGTAVYLEEAAATEKAEEVLKVTPAKKPTRVRRRQLG